MRDALGDDLGRSGLPKVGGWVFLVVLPLVVVFALVAMLAPLGSGGRRVFSIVSQIASARSELLPILTGSQLGVSALVVAMAQFQPERWRRTPKELGDCWLSEVRLVASQENRYIASMIGLIGISGVIVFGVAACIFRRLDAGGILLLVVVWGIHAVSSAALIMVPATGVAAVDDYWRSLARLFYIAEKWPEGIRNAVSEAEVKRLPLSVRARRLRVVISLLLFALILVVMVVLEKYCSGGHLGLRRQCVAGCLVVIATLGAIGSGYYRWGSGIISSVPLYFSALLVLVQGFLVEVESIVVVTNSSLWRNLGFIFAVIATSILAVLLSVVASGARFLWGRFDCLKSILAPIWVHELKLQSRYGDRCSVDERRAIERSFVKLAKKRKKGLAETVKESVLLPFVTK